MNNQIITPTFSNTVTEQLGYETFFNVIAAFRAKARKVGLTSAEHVLYNKFRGLALDRGFTPITNQNKLNNGLAAMSGFALAEYYAVRLLKENKYLEDNFKINESVRSLIVF